MCYHQTPDTLLDGQLPEFPEVSQKSSGAHVFHYILQHAGHLYWILPYKNNVTKVNVRFSVKSRFLSICE